jgi:hypothetical protein
MRVQKGIHSTIYACFLASLLIGGPFIFAEDTTIPRVLNPPVDSDLNNLPGDLRAIAIPGPSNLSDFVKNPTMARALGKALFWDMQVGRWNTSLRQLSFSCGCRSTIEKSVEPGHTTRS